MVMIEIENIKKFMAGFLGGNLFDDFLMSEGKLSMNISYEFDGKILKEFYDTEEWKEMKQYPYVTWEEEKEKIDKQAEKENLKTATFVRKVVLDYIENKK